MKDNVTLKDYILKAYDTLNNEYSEYDNNNNMWYSGMYLNIYNLYEVYMKALCNSFTDVICGDNEKFSIINLPINFIAEKLNLKKENFKFIFNYNLNSLVDDNIKPAKSLVSQVKNSFHFNHFGNDEANEKMTDKLNIILSERKLFDEKPGNWFSNLKIQNYLLKDETLLSSSLEKKEEGEEFVYRFFGEYSKSVRHELAHEFIQEKQMNDIKNKFPMDGTIKMFKDSIEKIDKQFNYLYGSQVSDEHNENIISAFI